MKKTILTLVILFGISLTTYSQNFSKNAIGLRLGDNDGFGGEVSYQRGLDNDNRLEFDLGWRNSRYVDAFKLAGLYQWVWNIEGGFNWYAGVGGGIGSWSYDKKNEDRRNGTILFAAGDIGIEYNFKIPLMVSLDFRPELYFNNDDVYRDGNFGPDIALGVRYRFD